MAAIHSIQTDANNPKAQRAMILFLLQDIEQKIDRLDAVVYAARRMHEANARDDQDYDPTDARLYDVLAAELANRSALIKLREELERLLPA